MTGCFANLRIKSVHPMKFVKSDDPTRRRRQGSMTVLLIVSFLLVMTIVLVRSRRDDSWISAAKVADSLYGRMSSRPIVSDWPSDTSWRQARREARVPRILNIELNSADSMELCRIYGIGPVLSSRIIAYRDRLGGYADILQLTEIKGITDEVFERISPNFWIDSAKIIKIDINFVTRKQLLAHPYVTTSMADRMLRGSRMEGGYSTLNDLINRDILLPKEVRRMAPYLSFTTVPLEGANFKN